MAVPPSPTVPPSAAPGGPAPSARGARPIRRHRRLLGLAVVGVLAVIAAGCYQLDENNRANPVFGASNGQLGSQRLVEISPGCSVYWEMAQSMRQMLSGAADAGVTITPSSCYRDYAGQVAARDSWCARGACHMAAVPGTSNHGWGKAVDFREGAQLMTYDSPGYAWLVANAGIYGWIQPKGMKQGGPVPEPWHWEWIGDGGRMFPGEYFGVGNALPLTGSPIGNLEGAWATPGAIRLGGWTLDPDRQDPIDVHVYVDGGWGGIHVANKARPDVAAAFPAYSTKPHGFDITVPWSAGPHTVCAYAIDMMAPGINLELGCRTVDVPAGSGSAAVVDEPAPTTTTSTTTAPPSTTTTTVPPTTTSTTAPPVTSAAAAATTSKAVTNSPRPSGS